MQIQKLERVFKYAGLTLPDPNPSLDTEGVRALYYTKSQNQNSLASPWERA